MKRLMLVIGVAFGCLLLFSVSAASASTVITASNAGEGSHSFVTSGFSSECATTTYAGTAANSPEGNVTLHPTYSECTSSLGSSPIDTAGCNYVLSGATSESQGKTEIECSGTNKIKITAPGCTLSFGPQTATGGATYSNLGTGSSREVTAKQSETLTFTKSGFGCFVISGNTGTYTGTVKMKGYGDQGGPSNEDEYIEGAQRGLWWEGESFWAETP